MPTKRHSIDATLAPREIGRRIRKLRKKREWTGAELACACGMGDARLSQIELGKKLPSLDNVIQLSLKLRRSMEWVLYGTTPSAKLWTWLARRHKGGKA